MHFNILNTYTFMYMYFANAYSHNIVIASDTEQVRSGQLFSTVIYGFFSNMISKVVLIFEDMGYRTIFFFVFDHSIDFRGEPTRPSSSLTACLKKNYIRV